jgi:hypothetical protein
MKELILYILFLFVNYHINAQVQWAKQIGSPSIAVDEFSEIISDGTNIYMIGYFGGSLYLPNDTLYSNGNYDIFISKFDANGNNLWAKNIGGNSSSTMDSENANAVFDPINNCIYLSGHFTNAMYLSGIGYLNGNSDIFLIKMDLDGNFIWAKKAGGNGIDQAQVYLNPFGKIYLITQSTDSAYFDSFHVGPGGAIATYDEAGNCLSAELKFNSSIFTGFNSVNLNFVGKDAIFYGAFISNTFTIDTATIYSQGNYDAFIARADSTGKIKWIHSFGTEGFEAVTNVFVSNNNTISFLAVLNDTINFLGNTLSIEGNDVILSTISENGELDWVKKFNINSTTQVSGLGLNRTANDNLAVVGYFNGTAHFGNLQMTSNTAKDMFLAKFDTTGNCLSFINFGQATGRSLAIDNSDNIYVCGNFNNTINIGNNTFTVYGGSSDIYLAKFDATLGNNNHTAPNNTLVIYANPNNGTCNMTIPDDLKSSPNLTLMIYNAQGSLIQKQQIQQMQDKVKLSLDNEAKGLYNVTLTDGTKMYYGKIMYE